MTKQELLSEARRLSLLHEEKKSLINKIFNDLDKEVKTSEKHVNGMTTVNFILNEMEILEQQHAKILIEIKK